MQNTKEFYDAFSAAITQQADPFHMPVIAPPPSADSIASLIDLSSRVDVIRAFRPKKEAE